MPIQPWVIVAGLAAVDLLILAGFYLGLRVTPPVPGSVLSAQGMGLLGFVIHALIFFRGIFLALQLALIACVYGLCLLHHHGRLPGRRDEATG